MNIIDFLFHKKKEEDNLSNSFLKKYVDSLDVPTDYVRLSGPFLEEVYALKYIELYKDLLKKTYYRVNLCIQRPVAIISYDETLQTMDNSRVDLKISPYNHRFELFKGKTDFSVIGVDGCILLNKDDSNNIKSVLTRFPITQQELKNLHSTADA
jgi:hypothetical protein